MMTKPQRTAKFEKWAREDGQLADMLFLVLLTGAALILRFCLFPFRSGDYQQFLEGWFNTLQANGGVLGVNLVSGDYMPPYYYVLGLLSYLPLPPLFSIKLLSCIMDVVLAFQIRRLVGVAQGGALRANAAYAVLLFLPSVFLNSAAWAQCDVIFVTALVLFVLALIRQDSNRAVIWFSVAFVFKLQAIFLAPLLLLFLLKGRIKWRSMLCLPAVYLAAVLPALIMGRSLWELLTVYFRQAGQYDLLSMYLPNMWTWVFGRIDPSLGRAGVFFAGGVVLCSLYFLMKKEFEFTPGRVVSLAFFFALLVPFLLPYMHERYFYPADILSVAFAFLYPKKWYLTAVLCLASANAVCHNLYGTEFLPVQVWGLAVLAVLLLLTKHIIKEIREAA